MKPNIFNITLISLFVFLFFFVVAHSFYVIYIAKDFDYLIDMSCDPNSEKCFQRDCTNPDDCPPNKLSVYKQSYVTAKYFPECTDNSCDNLYKSNPGLFRKVECDESNGDTCVGFGVATTTE
jgi:hypothetical protein